jgi:hypothetical protein
MSQQGKQVCHVVLAQILSAHPVDYVRDLNNYLQNHPLGNFAAQLSWDLTQSGPGHQVTHYATAKCKPIVDI